MLASVRVVVVFAFVGVVFVVFSFVGFVVIVVVFAFVGLVFVGYCCLSLYLLHGLWSIGMKYSFYKIQSWGELLHVRVLYFWSCLLMYPREPRLIGIFTYLFL